MSQTDRFQTEGEAYGNLESAGEIPSCGRDAAPAGDERRRDCRRSRAPDRYGEDTSISGKRYAAPTAPLGVGNGNRWKVDQNIPRLSSRRGIQNI